MKINMSQSDLLKSILFFVSAVSMTFLNFNYIFISVIGAYMLLDIFYIASNKLRGDANVTYYIIEFVVLSVIMPNGYVVQPVAIVLWLITMPKEKKIRLESIVIIAVILLNVIINSVNIQNLFFSIFYLVPFLLMSSIFVLKNMNIDEFSMNKVNSLLRLISFTEFFAVLAQFIKNKGNSYVDLDWVSGTFGYLEGRDLTISLLCIFVFFFSRWNHNKNNIDIIYMLICLITATLTGCIGVTMIFAFVLVLYSLFNAKIKMRYKIFIIALIVVIAFVVVVSNAQWVVTDIMSLTNGDYLRKRVSKLDMYYTTFIDIPRADKHFLFWGEGVGCYTSRAAMACTGNYSDLYNMFFSNPSVSEYTNIYLNMWIKNGYQGGMSAAPYSGIISIFGEIGLIGCILIIGVIVRVWKKACSSQKFIILFLIGILFYDNFLEMGRCATMCAMVFGIVGSFNVSEKLSFK